MKPQDAILALEAAHKEPGAETRERAVVSLRGLRAVVAPSDWPQLDRLAAELESGRTTALKIWRALAPILASQEPMASAPAEREEPPPRGVGGLRKDVRARAGAHEDKARELRQRAADLKAGGRLASPSIREAAARALGAADAHDEFARELRDLMALIPTKQPAKKVTPAARQRPGVVAGS